MAAEGSSPSITCRYALSGLINNQHHAINAPLFNATSSASAFKIVASVSKLMLMAGFHCKFTVYLRSSIRNMCGAGAGLDR